MVLYSISLCLRGELSSHHYPNPLKQKTALWAVSNYFAAFLAAVFEAAFAMTAAAVFFLRGRNLPNEPA
jgi:hypothetical protein